MSDSPTGVARIPVARMESPRMDTVATRPAWPAIQSATRCQAPVVVISVWSGCGTKGQNSFRPNRPNSGGRTNSTNTAATTRPAAACTPRLRVVGDSASSNDSSASTTVALLATMAGPAKRIAVNSACRWLAVLRSSSRYREMSSSA